MENIASRIVCIIFWGVKVKAEYEVLFKQQNCREATFKNSSPTFLTTATIIPPASINGTQKPESWELDGRELKSFKDPKAYLHIILKKLSKIQPVSTCFSFNKPSF